MAILWIYPIADIKDPRFSAYFRFETVVAVLFAVVLWQINKWWAAFFLLAFISSIYPFSTKVSADAFLAVFFGSLWFYFISNYTRPEWVRHLLDAICILALCNIGLLISQHFGFDPIFKAKGGGGGAPVVGFLSNRNEVSAFLAFALPAFFRDRWKRLVPIVFLGLTIARSTGGPLAAIAMVYAYFFLKDGIGGLRINWVKIGLVTIWFALFLAYIDMPVEFRTITTNEIIDASGEIKEPISTKTEIVMGSSGSQRVSTWTKGLKLYTQHPVTGSGIGHWKIVFLGLKKPGKTWWKQAHNEFVQGVFEMGILFVVVMVGYFTGIVRRYHRGAILSITAAGIVVINSCFNFPLHIAQTAVLAITWLAILEIELREAI